MQRLGVGGGGAGKLTQPVRVDLLKSYRRGFVPPSFVLMCHRSSWNSADLRIDRGSQGGVLISRHIHS